MSSSTRLQWNKGGWLGSQLGGSLWMAIGGISALPSSLVDGVIVLALFAATNLAGVLLWRRRERLSAYAGIQLLLATIGVCGAAVVYVLDAAELFESIQLDPPVPARVAYAILAAVVLGLMLLFHLRFAPTDEGEGAAG